MVELRDGRKLPYDAVVLATGARNRPLGVGGAEHVLYLRTLDESAEIKRRFAETNDVVVIGGGFIGLEVAAAARMLGKNVTVIEALPRLMARVVAPVVSEYFRAQHEARGVRLLFGAVVGSIERDGVMLGDGTRIPADLIVAGIGVIPNDSLARDAGLAVGNGIVVDEFLRTSDPSIYGIGDCAEYPNPFAGARVRLESVQNAVDQATCVARAIAGKRAKYEAAPWFWSDQFDIHLQMAGLSTGTDHTVTRGDPATNKFSTFYYKGVELKAIDSINRPAEHLTARKLIAARAHVTPEQAADEGFDLKAATLSK
jgi:3-phenylpropionate/trans-cinnamate dioxygenase ferredoxin reductase subunit